MLQASESGSFGWQGLFDPVEIVQTREPGQIILKLEQVENLVERGLYAAGFVAYEAAEGIDSAFRTRHGRDLPLLWFGLYRKMEPIELPCVMTPETFSLGQWTPSISVAEYEAAFDRIKNYIASGDTYQVNFTLRLRSLFEGDPWQLFCRLCRAQPSPFAAFVDTGRYAICSASPELFFTLEGRDLVSKPMKGTAPRGLTPSEDNARKKELEVSEKNRAENAMIVDMVRNDMGRIADVGSVRVSSLFKVERLPTVFQMTSTVTCTTSASFTEIMKALFPCASITGAPKVRTMEIIRDVEKDRRGIYTGCIGYLAPGRRAMFNVAIRTVVIDREHKKAQYGSGGGIVWDSVGAEEYAECQTKAMVLFSDRPEFELLESLLWDGENGYFLLDGHLKRLGESAEYFNFAVDLDALKTRLEEFGKQIGLGKHKVRLCVNRTGNIFLESTPIMSRPASSPWKLGLAIKPVDWRDPFLYHKTTNRAVYNSAATNCTDCDDILLWNEHGEVTETKIGNLVIEKDGQLLTPPVKCGLLAGAFRAFLLERGEIAEKIIKVQDLQQAKKIFMINSVRKWLPAVIVFGPKIA
ncbi:MAG: aminodeoxychorismate synthase component I [Phycisphaerae bacterium]